MLFLFICQSEYMFRPQLGHHQVTSRLYNRGSSQKCYVNWDIGNVQQVGLNFVYSETVIILCDLSKTRTTMLFVCKHVRSYQLDNHLLKNQGQLSRYWNCSSKAWGQQADGEKNSADDNKHLPIFSVRIIFMLCR